MAKPAALGIGRDTATFRRRKAVGPPFAGAGNEADAEPSGARRTGDHAQQTGRQFAGAQSDHRRGQDRGIEQPGVTAQA
jgi:hypothetical protein